MSGSQQAASHEIRHPVFARLYDRLSGPMERELAAHRDELLSGLSGRVLEIGAGNGINFRHYPPTVEAVVALEPEPYLRRKAETAAAGAPVPVSVRDGVAERLPLEDAAFDAAVASSVLCTVRDQPSALAELRRVLKPGGELRFMEHVRSGSPCKARLQRGLDRSGVWPRLAGGCHCARDTVGAIEAAAFELGRLGNFDLGPSWLFTNPHVLGAARTGPTPGAQDLEGEVLDVGAGTGADLRHSSAPRVSSGWNPNGRWRRRLGSRPSRPSDSS